MDQLGPLPDDLSEGGPRSVPGLPPAIRTRKSSLPVEDLGPQELEGDSAEDILPSAPAWQSGDTGAGLHAPPETPTPASPSGESGMRTPRSSPEAAPTAAPEAHRTSDQAP